MPARVGVAGKRLKAEQANLAAFFGAGAGVVNHQAVPEVDHAVVTASFCQRMAVEHEVTAFGSCRKVTQIDAVETHQLLGIGHADQAAGFHVSVSVWPRRDTEHAAAYVRQRITGLDWRCHRWRVEVGELGEPLFGLRRERLDVSEAQQPGAVTMLPSWRRRGVLGFSDACEPETERAPFRRGRDQSVVREATGMRVHRLSQRRSAQAEQQDNKRQAQSRLLSHEAMIEPGCRSWLRARSSFIESAAGRYGVPVSEQRKLERSFEQLVYTDPEQPYRLLQYADPFPEDLPGDRFKLGCGADWQGQELLAGDDRVISVLQFHADAATQAAGAVKSAGDGASDGRQFLLQLF